jgi:hypothetical protein
MVDHPSDVADNHTARIRLLIQDVRRSIETIPVQPSHDDLGRIAKYLFRLNIRRPELGPALPKIPEQSRSSFTWFDDAYHN